MVATPVEVDHVFVMVGPDAPEAAVALVAAGLRESFRRDHPGQGSTNACYCFDNAYLELLWLRDPAEARTPPAARLRLAERADRQGSDASPFGIALRTAADQLLPFETWAYEAPYLPQGVSIAVAVASEDPRQPLLFRSPGSRRPDRWTDGRAGTRQTSAGFADIMHLHLDLAGGVPACAPLQRLQQLGVLSLGAAPAHRMELTLSRPPAPPRRLVLPDFTWTD